MKSFIQTSKVLILSIAVLMVMGYAQAAWDAPSGAPSELNNAPTPINVSNSQQDKAGKLTASVLGADSLCLTGDGCITEWPEVEVNGSENPKYMLSICGTGTAYTTRASCESSCPSGTTFVNVVGSTDFDGDGDRAVVLCENSTNIEPVNNWISNGKDKWR